MSNITLSYPNRIDEAVIAEAGSASWSSTLPLSNIQDHVIKKVARTQVNNLQSVININFPAQIREIGCIALVNHNLTTNATVRFVGYSGLSGTGTVRFDSTASYKAFPVLFIPESGLIPFENTNFWSGTVEESQRLSYTRLCVFYPTEGNQMCQSVQVVISDVKSNLPTSSTSLTVGTGVKVAVTQTNLSYGVGQDITLYSNATPANYMYGKISSYNKSTGDIVLVITETGGSGTANDWKIANGNHYLQIGRIFLGRTIEPSINPEYGELSQGYIDLTEMQRAADNTKYFYAKPKMRTLDCQLKHLAQTESFSGFYDAQREVGLSGEVLYTYSQPEYVKVGGVNINMTTDKNYYARTFLANFAQLNPITSSFVDGYSTALKLEEIV